MNTHTHNEDQSKHLPGWCSDCTVLGSNCVGTAWGGLNSRHRGGLHIVDTHTQDCDSSSGHCTDPSSPRTGAHPSTLSTVDTRVYTAQPLSATTPPLMHLIDTLGHWAVTWVTWVLRQRSRALRLQGAAVEDPAPGTHTQHHECNAQQLMCAACMHECTTLVVCCKLHCTHVCMPGVLNALD